MKLFLIERADDSWGYDEFDSFVVAAKDEADAKVVVPRGSDWPVEPDGINATYIGTAKPDTKRGVILGSFHAG